MPNTTTLEEGSETMRYLSSDAFSFSVVPSKCGQFYWFYFINDEDTPIEIGPIDRSLNPSNKLHIYRDERRACDYTFDRKRAGVYRADDNIHTTSEYCNEVAWQFAKVVYLLGINIHTIELNDIPTDGMQANCRDSHTAKDSNPTV